MRSPTPHTPTPDGLVQMGRIVGTHGLRGGVKVAPEADDAEGFTPLSDVWVGPAPEAVRRFGVVQVQAQPSRHGLTVLLRLGGVETREEAQRLRGLYVFAAEADLPPLEDDAFYFHDLVGLEAVTEAGQALGVVTAVLEMPAQPVLAIRRPGGTEVLVPAVAELVTDIDLEARRLVIRPIEGLL